MQLAKTVLIPLGLTTAASAVNKSINKKCQFRENNINNFKQRNGITKIVKALIDSDISIKDICETIENKANEQQGGFLGEPLSTLASILLENIYEDKRATVWKQGRGVIKAGQKTIRVGQDF